MSRRTTLTRKAAALVIALSAATGLAACSSASGNEEAVRKDGTVDLSKVTLTVGDQKGGSQALLKAAGEIGKTPYKIEWKSFTSGPPLLEALMLADRVLVLEDGHLAHEWQIPTPRHARTPTHPHISEVREQVLAALGVQSLDQKAAGAA